MSSTASILHADLDAFYASVEQRDDPQLRGRPVIVGSGVVLACSYEAKARGVRTAMNGGQARRICPEAVFVAPRMSSYSEASKAVYSIFNETSPLVEGISIDEAFLDAGGLGHITGTPVEVAAKLKGRVLDEVGLQISVGVARTKFLAKIASGESKPDGLLLVEPEHEAAFLHPLPIERVWGVGRVTSEKLRSMGIRTVGEIAACGESRLVAALGRSAGLRLLDLANNRDPRPVSPREPRRSIGAQSAFPRSSKTAVEIDALAAGLVDRTARRLRRAGKICGTVSISLRFDDMKRAGRSHSFPSATNQTEVILAAVRNLLDGTAELIDQHGITLLGVSLEKLTSDDAVQLGFNLDGSDNSALDAAIDDVRDRFGADAITRASLVESGSGVSVPILPD
jgi:DNA polymerase-4